MTEAEFEKKWEEMASQLQRGLNTMIGLAAKNDPWKHRSAGITNKGFEEIPPDVAQQLADAAALASKPGGFRKTTGAGMTCATCMWFAEKVMERAPKFGDAPFKIEGEPLPGEYTYAVTEMYDDITKHPDGSITSTKTGETLRPAGDYPGDLFGRCRRHAPSMQGYPAVFGNDWCGDHKLDENKR